MATQNDRDSKVPGASRGHEALVLTAVIATGVAGALIAALIPLLVQMLVEHRGMTVVESGDAVSLRMLGGTIGSILVVVATSRFSWRWIAGVSLLVVLLGNLMAALVDDAGALLFAQALTGLGEGGTIIIGAAIAVTRNPDRGYGIYLVVSLLLGSALYHVVPLFEAHIGLLSLLAPLGAIALVALLLVRWFPERNAAESPSGAPSVKPSLLSVAAIVSLVAMGLYFIGLTTLWSCIEQIGSKVAGPDHSVESAIGNIYLVMGIAGALVSVVCGDRFGQRLPLLVSCGLGVLAMLLIAGSSWAAFLAGTMALVFSWMMAFPYLMGLVALVDPTGRLAVAGLVLQTGCFTVGPSLGTRLLTSYPAGLTELVVACFALTAVAVYVASRRCKAQSLTAAGIAR
ncbi:MFS transporter [Pseudomonas sp. LFM046]|uniref:MFS transporter n=1 Tax=Pseudomonas sp. LFM046 TaxID=1608357 RepID=UPI001304F57C|nr:MFS transporter [Pseudomonas sp. LFM046]